MLSSVGRQKTALLCDELSKTYTAFGFVEFTYSAVRTK